jgi:hypothetical protein
MTYDLQILRGQGNDTVAAFAPGRAISGTSKLITKFAHLFTRTQDVARGRGTDFSTLMATGRIRTSADVVLRFTSSAVDVLEQLGDQQGLPTTERLLRAELVSHEFTDRRLLLTVRLHTPDGSTEFPLPLDRT